MNYMLLQLLIFKYWPLDFDSYNKHTFFVVKWYVAKKSVFLSKLNCHSSGASGETRRLAAKFRRSKRNRVHQATDAFFSFFRPGSDANCRMILVVCPFRWRRFRPESRLFSWLVRWRKRCGIFQHSRLRTSRSPSGENWCGTRACEFYRSSGHNG